MQEVWNKMTFAEQMANISGEVQRIINILENGGGVNLNDIGSMQTIIRAFKKSQNDPKNIDRLSELNKAENELTELIALRDKVSKRVFNSRVRAVKKYWKEWLDLYCKEILLTRKTVDQ